jgi:GT2 family glycosyltransferase
VLPKISINISVRNSESASIVLESLQKIQYPAELFEVLIIKGGYLTKQRNKGIAHSKGEIIYLLDNDSIVTPNALRVIAREFKNKNVAAVGGPSLNPKKGSYFSTVVGYILATYFGAFRMRFKWSNHKKIIAPNDYHFIGCNLAFRKNIVKKIGGFDERFRANDETELIRRIRDKGFLLRYSHKLVVYKGQRSNPVLLAKQFHHYGKGRMQHLLKNPQREDLFLLAPLGFMGYLFSLPFYRSELYVLPLGFYIFLGVLTALKASIKHKRPDLLVTMNILFPVIHISYGMGLLHELISRDLPILGWSKANLNKKSYSTQLQILKVNTVGRDMRSNKYE